MTDEMLLLAMNRLRQLGEEMLCIHSRLQGQMSSDAEAVLLSVRLEDCIKENRKWISAIIAQYQG